MGLNEEMEKAKEELEKNPMRYLGKKAYEDAQARLKERLGEKGFLKFMRDTDFADPKSLINQALRFLRELEEESGVELCEDCMLKALSNFYKSKSK